MEKKSTIYEPLIESLRKLQVDKNLTGATMGEYLGVSESMYSRFLSGKVGLKFGHLANLASALKMDIVNLFSYPDVYTLDNKEEKVSIVVQIKLTEEQKRKVLANGDLDKNIIDVLEGDL